MIQEDPELIDRARKGDEAAFRMLVDAHSARVHTIAYQLVGNDEDARDIAQDVFVRLHRSLGRFDPALSFEAWLYRLTVNLAIDHRRRNARHRGVSLDQVEEALADGGAGPDTRAERAEMRNVIQGLLKELSARQEKAFVLRDLQGFSTEEAAAILDCRPATLRVHLARARQRIARTLKKRYPELVADRGHGEGDR